MPSLETHYMKNFKKSELIKIIVDFDNQERKIKEENNVEFIDKLKYQIEELKFKIKDMDIEIKRKDKIIYQLNTNG